MNKKELLKILNEDAYTILEMVEQVRDHYKEKRNELEDDETQRGEFLVYCDIFADLNCLSENIKRMLEE